MDLSCPCVTAETACSLFNICLSLFLEQSTDVGRVVALDEAHKYMTDNAECQTLTESLLSAIRLQRHLGARVFISTQEPTISPRLLDLCSVTIAHRFTSPEWMKALRKHLAGVSYQAAARAKRFPSSFNELEPGAPILPESKSLDTETETFSRIVTLKTGEALLFAPSAIMNVEEQCDVCEQVTPESRDSAKGSISDKMGITKLGHGILKVRIRRRVTEDGGQSVMAR